MGHNCCVPLCSSDGKRHRGLSFHVIPSDPTKKKEWEDAIRNDNLASKPHVCGLHFVTGRRQYGEMPSIFPWTAGWADIVTKYNTKMDTVETLSNLSGITPVKVRKININTPPPSSLKKLSKRRRTITKHSKVSILTISTCI